MGIRAGPSCMITQTRDLRTGVSYWQTGREPFVPTSHLAADVETDVLIIGAGISGLVIAEFFSERHQVVVVDRRGPAKGSTVASTALRADRRGGNTDLQIRRRQDGA